MSGAMRRSTVLVAAAAGLLALVGCGGGGSGNKTAGAQGASATSVVEDTPTTAAPAAAAASGGAAGGPATTAKRTTPTSASKAAPAGAGPTAAATAGGGATPLPAGTYRYDTSGMSQSSGGAARPVPAVTTLKADPASGVSQHTLRDLRDSNGQGQAIDTVLLFQPDGVRLQSLKVTTNVGGGITDVRDLRADPPALIARTGGGVGDRYEFTLTGSGTTFHGVITVQRPERLVIGGQAVDTVVVQLKVDFSGSVTGNQTSTAWVDPTHLLNVKEQVVTDAKAGVLTTHTEYTATLQRLRPG